MIGANDAQGLAAVAAIMTFLAIVIYRLIHGKLRDEFVLQADHDSLEERTATMEKRIGDMPAHGDFRSLSDRVGKVEQGVAVAQASLDGLGNSIKRVEHQVDLLVAHQIGESGR